MHTLLVAVSDTYIGFPTVRGTGAGIVLNSTAALESGAFVQESGTIDGKWPVRGIVLDHRGSSAAEVACKGLHVSGCQDGAEPGKCTNSERVFHVL